MTSLATQSPGGSSAQKNIKKNEIAIEALEIEFSEAISIDGSHGNIPSPTYFSRIYDWLGHTSARSSEAGDEEASSSSIGQGRFDGADKLVPTNAAAACARPFLNRSSTNPFTTSPYDITRAVSEAAISPLGDASPFGPEYTAKVNMQRAILRIRCIHPQHLKNISEDLHVLLSMSRLQIIAIEAIMKTRVDKLLSEILETNHEEYFGRFEWWIRVREASKIFTETLVPQAKVIQQTWQKKFPSAYDELDQKRRDYMTEEGALHDVEFKPENRDFEEGCRLFSMKEGWLMPQKAFQFGEQGFKPGDWWLNMCCAIRDGIIEDPEKKSSAVYPRAVMALALLWGLEKDSLEDNVVEYTIEGEATDMKSSLLGQRGRPIRLLRGYTLKSDYAPMAGIRYDGLYKLDTYSMKLVDENTGTYRLKLILRRCPDQVSMEQLTLIPSPMQLDDWKLYQDFLDESFRSQFGDGKAYKEWRTSNHRHLRKKNDWSSAQLIPEQCCDTEKHLGLSVRQNWR